MRTPRIPRVGTPSSAITPAERRVYALLGRGLCNKEICRELGSSLGSLNATQGQRVLLRSGQHIQILQAEDGVLRLYSTGANGLRVEWGGVTADFFRPTNPPVLPDTATPAQIVQALRAIGLVQ